MEVMPLYCLLSRLRAANSTNDGFGRISLKKSENDPARKSRICAAGGVKDAEWPRGSMKLVAEADR
jgi:hypothetical protein